MAETNIGVIIQAYQKTLDARDSAQCVAFFTEDAAIHFGSGCYSGKEAIEEWHKDRFGANLQIIDYQEICIEGNKAVIDIVVSSDKLKKWKIINLPAKATFLFEGYKIKEARFSAAMSSIFEAFFAEW